MSIEIRQSCSIQEVPQRHRSGRTHEPPSGSSPHFTLTSSPDCVLTGIRVGQLLISDAGDFDVDVDTVQEGTADLLLVAGDGHAGGKCDRAVPGKGSYVTSS